MYCRKCGKELPDDSQFCLKCGTALTLSTSVPAPARPAKASRPLSGLAKLVIGGSLFIFVIAIIAILASNPGSSVTPATQTPALNSSPPSSAMSTGNAANDRLSALPKADQATALATVVGEGCVGKRSFYMGSSKTDLSAFWSVGCTNGKSYLVQIDADSVGSTKVLECGMYKLVTKMSCFAKLN